MKECDDGEVVVESEESTPAKRIRHDSSGNPINSGKKANYSIAFLDEVLVCKF
jgi:hypothetical protein